MIVGNEKKKNVLTEMSSSSYTINYSRTFQYLNPPSTVMHGMLSFLFKSSNRQRDFFYIIDYQKAIITIRLSCIPDFLHSRVSQCIRTIYHITAIHNSYNCIWEAVTISGTLIFFKKKCKNLHWMVG